MVNGPLSIWHLDCFIDEGVIGFADEEQPHRSAAALASYPLVTISAAINKLMKTYIQYPIGTP